MSNQPDTKHPEKMISLSHNFNQLSLEDIKPPDCFNEIVEELYNLYNEERLKFRDSGSIINTLDQFLRGKQQSPDNIINWCLDDQINP
ncbi:12575_t:CDS:1, partial [Cetraspora pellucida]